MIPAPDDFELTSSDYNGVARLFPLRETIMFPNVMQPVHVFEPHTIQLVEDALAGDNLIAMVLVAEAGADTQSATTPLQKYGCLCRIVAHARQEDGTYNLLLVGLRRVELLAEIVSRKLFRQAYVRVLEDQYPKLSTPRRSELQTQLLQSFHNTMPLPPEAYAQLESVLVREIPLGILTDIISFTLELRKEFKLQLLSESNVDLRAISLLDWLQKSAPRKRPKFPPDFSLN